MKKELESAYQAGTTKMSAFLSNSDPYAGMGVRTGASHCEKEAAIEREYDQVLEAIARMPSLQLASS